MCRRLYVVSTDVGGIPEVLPADTMELASPDVDSLCVALERALTRVRSGEAPAPDSLHARVAQYYSWERIAARTERLYHSAVLELAQRQRAQSSNAAPSTSTDTLTSFDEPEPDDDEDEDVEEEMEQRACEPLYVERPEDMRQFTPEQVALLNSREPVPLSAAALARLRCGFRLRRMCALHGSVRFFYLILFCIQLALVVILFWLRPARV